MAYSVYIYIFFFADLLHLLVNVKSSRGNVVTSHERSCENQTVNVQKVQDDKVSNLGQSNLLVEQVVNSLGADSPEGSRCLMVDCDAVFN